HLLLFFFLEGLLSGVWSKETCPRFHPAGNRTQVSCMRGEWSFAVGKEKTNFHGKEKKETTGAKTRVVCYHCRRPGHFRSECKKIECKTCGKKGHISPDRRSKTKWENCGKIGHMTKYYRHEEKSANLELKNLVEQINSEFKKL
uniref:CCHC-type domain-containing protein n=1 Tax=Callorhinchus milii TaxID=7868 RepID=A0A4W3KAU1_CALMI